VIDEPILLYMHPTTVILVDDNDLFLQTLDLRMPAEMAYLLYHNPRLALERVNEKLALPSISERCFARPAKTLHWPESVVRLDFSLIEQEINNTERFRRTSVVIVDYSMPAMDGLTFCADIADPFVKKVLMTGAGDETLAVNAFNEGVIDRFVPKNQTTTLDMVVDFAQELQREYFFDQQRAIQESLSLDPPALLSDPTVVSYFGDLRTKYRFVEHYLVGDPPGFVFVTARGALFRLLVLSDTEVTQQVEYAAKHGAPLDVIQAVASRSRIGFFSERAETYADDPYPWGDFLYAPTRLEGKQVWWAALVTNAPFDVDFDARNSSFQAYLDEIDADV
jgi:CheY-like chemotaxis protein